ncbi:DUF2383 domain-containing protein [Puniceibacterium sp. IMCC21224]|uniref:DUF2383 domain-containing protein n=1 Tax=Puniceibacterium sp. IMCC21224 TaxID=1618204 RepID=UPI00064DCD83|nr:DUF2383 domain-containing protein [Puniceibacterium sp. IMCC21224]KMK68706.1 protein of unknown function (DUF2383) [Puniceibacterium sp. IMCC21224]
MQTTNLTVVPAPATNPQIVALQEVLSRTVDARAGFDAMVDKAAPGFRSTALKFRETHYQHTDRLAAILTALGAEPDTDGGVMATVNKAAVVTRSLFEEIDADVMGSIRENEAEVLNGFDAALTYLPEGHHHRDVSAMRGELQDLLDDTRQIG